MTDLQKLAEGVAGILIALAIITAFVVVTSVVGGAIGAGIATAYNYAFGTAYSVTKFALIGSVVFVATSSASLSGDS